MRSVGTDGLKTVKCVVLWLIKINKLNPLGGFLEHAVTSLAKLSMVTTHHTGICLAYGSSVGSSRQTPPPAALFYPSPSQLLHFFPLCSFFPYDQYLALENCTSSEN